MGFKIEITGIKELQDKFKNVSKELGEQIQDELVAFGANTVGDAKRLAPVNEGFLRNSITFETKPFEIDIIVAADYAAYIEFGTRGFAAKYVATLPPDWQTFAGNFRGKGGGNMDEFIMRLVEWVKKKGIGATYNVSTKKRDRVGKQSAATTAEADAYAIALYILRHGIRPQPFLFPAIEKNRQLLINELKAILK